MINKWYTKEEVIKLFQNTDNDLIKLSLNYNSSKLLDPECTPYLTHYNNMLKEYRNKPIKILEIGVKEGDSLKIWKDYLHPESKIYGIEKNPTPLEFFKQENTEIFYGSQTDIPFLNSVISKIGKVDVIIDDGGHTNNQLKTTFNYLFEYGLQDNGLYIMEDLGTSYWYKWSGGLNNQNSILNFLKQKIDGINYRFWKGNRNDYVPKPNKSLVDSTYQDENILSITFMKGLAFIKKSNNKTGDE